MGRDKASLEIDGVLLWKRQLDLLNSICEPVSVIAPRRPCWLPDGRAFVRDDPDARGPMAGLLAALEWTRLCGGSHVLVLAVDLPRMTAQVLLKLAGACRSGQGLIPVKDSFFEPLCAVYPVEALPFFGESARRGQWKLQGVINDLLAEGLMVSHNLPPEDECAFFNLNSPRDLEALSGP